MKGRAHIFLGNKQVLFSSLHLHKAEAFWIAEEGSCEDHAIVLLILPSGSHHQFPLSQKLLQDAAELLPILLRHREECSQFLFLHRNIQRISHKGLDHFLAFSPGILILM